MAFLLQSPYIRYPLLIFGYQIFLMFLINAASIWDPFCKEDILYTPYVRVFQKGRNGALLRDRGPGFINIGGMKDIYVCTNGLVMMYYTKTKGMGVVFEQGELHSTPHHCELYNPSTNSGIRGDHPKKTLLSIILIGHPEDYRRPALQIFVAPTYDTVHKDYINITSLIMMGTDGECLIEKGVEKARLRIRNAEPRYMQGKTYNATIPPSFCQLDAQRTLGQQGLIKLAVPGYIHGDYLYKFDIKPSFFNGSAVEKEKFNVQHPRHQGDTGSTVSPRFHASGIETVRQSYGITSYNADEVYAALINDRQMKFVGCMRYPDFNSELMRIIETRKNDTQQLDLEKEGLLIKDSEPPFWAEKVNVPWPNSATPKTNDARYTLYLGVDVSGGNNDFNELSKKSLDTAVSDLIATKASEPDENDIKAAEDDVIKEKMLFSLWPLKQAYAVLYKHVKDLEKQVKDAWENVHTEAFEALTNFTDLTDVESRKVSLIAHWKHTILMKISETKYERRFEPYNRQLVEEYDKYVEQIAILNSILKKKSIALGPMISNAEVLYSRYRVYKSLIKESIGDLQQAVEQLEKTRKPLDVVPVDPFDKYFVDTMIEIKDAEYVHLTPKITRGYVCNKIKPSSERAGMLFKNRQGKGRDWPADDMWRGQVLDMVEQIFHLACPYMSKDFASSLTKIMKGYLLAEPLGTGLKGPIEGSRLQAVDHEYQAIVYNMTYDETSLDNNNSSNTTESSAQLSGGKLRPMQPFWKQIISALEDCKNKVVPMQFWHNEDGDRPAYVTYRKFFPNNKTEAFFHVEDLMMQEKADFEYSFNWAVDLNWRIFATVLGICMPNYEKTIPLISARFYSLYSRDFLHPLRQVWMSNRDNPVLRTILGNYYNRGKGERWAKICMESSFMESGDRDYRPPRNLYVNAFTEMNYFTNGPMAGTSGILSVGENGID